MIVTQGTLLRAAHETECKEYTGGPFRELGSYPHAPMFGQPGRTGRCDLGLRTAGMCQCLCISWGCGTRYLLRTRKASTNIVWRGMLVRHTKRSRSKCLITSLMRNLSVAFRLVTCALGSRALGMPNQHSTPNDVRGSLASPQQIPCPTPHEMQRHWHIPAVLIPSRNGLFSPGCPNMGACGYEPSSRNGPPVYSLHSVSCAARSRVPCVTIMPNSWLFFMRPRRSRLPGSVL